jgi:hypothetical protein
MAGGEGEGPEGEKVFLQSSKSVCTAFVVIPSSPLRIPSISSPQIFEKLKSEMICLAENKDTKKPIRADTVFPHLELIAVCSPHGIRTNLLWKINFLSVLIF